VFFQHSAESAICCLGVRYVCSRSGFIVGLGGPSTIPWLTFLKPTQRRFCLTYAYVLLASLHMGSCPSQSVSLLGPAPPSNGLRLFSSQNFSSISTPTASSRLFFKLLASAILHLELRCLLQGPAMRSNAGMTDRNTDVDLSLAQVTDLATLTWLGLVPVIFPTYTVYKD
jgi:hypothetical protein